MKIGRLISATEQNRTSIFSPSTVAFSMNGPGINPEFSSGCVQSCVGATAAARCAGCGGDAACWDKCAGSGKGACVLGCN